MADFKDIETMFMKFNDFISLYECELKSPSVQDILNMFKCSIFVENSWLKLKQKDIASIFLNAFHTWLRKKNINKTYNENIFFYACDHLLGKLLSKHSEIAIRIYINNCSESRFAKFIQEHLNEYIACSSLCKFVYDSLDLKSELTARLLLQVWANSCNTSKGNEIQSKLKYQLSNHNLQTIVCRDIVVLSIESIDPTEIHVQNLILNQLLNHMEMRNSLIERFWMTVFFKVQRSVLATVCAKYISILDCLCNLITYLGLSMTLNKQEWVYDEAVHNFCPHLGYSHFVNIIKSLTLKSDKIFSYFEKKACDPNFMECVIWKSIFDDALC